METSDLEVYESARLAAWAATERKHEAGHRLTLCYTGLKPADRPDSKYIAALAAYREAKRIESAAWERARRMERDASFHHRSSLREV